MHKNQRPKYTQNKNQSSLSLDYSLYHIICKPIEKNSKWKKKNYPNFIWTNLIWFSIYLILDHKLQYKESSLSESKNSISNWKVKSFVRSIYLKYFIPKNNWEFKFKVHECFRTIYGISNCTVGYVIKRQRRHKKILLSIRLHI